MAETVEVGDRLGEAETVSTIVDGIEDGGEWELERDVDNLKFVGVFSTWGKCGPHAEVFA